MALQAAPAYIGDPTFEHPVELDRNILEAIFGRSGLVKPGDFALTPAVGSMQMAIGPGAAFIVGTETDAAQGGYFAWSEASENKAWPIASGSPRIDSLILRVQDNQYGPITGSPGAYWEIVTGTPSGSPVAVDDSQFASGQPHYIPGAWYRIANVRVNNGDTQINPALMTLFPQVVALNAVPITTTFTAGGTWNKLPGCKWIEAEVQAGGGGGGGAQATGGGTCAKGGGGGGGTYVRRRMSADLVSSSVSVTVGTGGGAGSGVSVSNGGNGNPSGFGTYIGATGGIGGSAGGASSVPYGSPGGAGGTTFTGAPDLVVPGGPGGASFGGATLGVSGVGGDSYLGAGGAARALPSIGAAVGTAGKVYGGGGSGGLSGAGAGAANGGAGADGIVIVTQYF